MTAEGCRLLYKHHLLQMFMILLHLFSELKTIIKIKCMYLQTDVYIHSLRDMVLSHIIVGRWHSCSQMATTSLFLPPPKRTYRTFLLALTKVTYMTLQGKHRLETLSKASFTCPFFPHVLQPTKPTDCSSSVEAVIEMLKPVKVS